MRFFICVVLLLQSLSLFAQSEHYNFYKLDTYTGLSHNQVNTILKDQDGFVWFGTMSGLNRYDGYSCKVFRKKYNDSSSLLDNNIRSLYELPNRKIWVLTMGGACIYNSSTEKFDVNYNGYLQSLGLPSGTIANIVKGNNGRYWFLYDNLDLYLYLGTEKKIRPFRKKQDFNDPEKITSLKETKDGKLWLVYQNGLLQKYDINSNEIVFSSTTFQNLNKGTGPYGLFIDNDGDIWLWGLNNGVFLFQPQDNSIKQFNENSFPSRLNANLVSQIVQDNKGLIWVATDHGGVTLIDKKDKFRTSYLLNDPKDLRSLGQNSITSMYKDDNGIIWLGTYKQGVSYLNSNVVLFPLYRHQESNVKSLPYDDVNRFVEDKSGNIWIGTNGGGLIFFDRKLKTFKQYLHDPYNKNSLSNNVIVSLCIDHENVLWIGTYFGGLNSFDGRKFTHYRHSDSDTSSLANDNVWEIFEDREQNLWIGTLGSGLDLFDRATNRFKHKQYNKGLQNPFPFDYISTMLQDKKGDLWVGTSGGIVIFEKDKTIPVFYQSSKDKNDLSNNSIICLLEDSKGRIWVGTREGLNLFNEQAKQFQTFTTSDGLPDNMILNILEDDHQTLWLSTPNGLCNVIPKQNKSGLVFSAINYDETNNLQNREFNDNAALRTRAGELIFGGPSGFNIIDPSTIRQPVYRPKIVFTGLQILNNTVEPGELINNRVLLQQSLSQLQSIGLKYKENVFSIEFASLDFGHSARNKYAYMMEGFNTDWLYADGSQRRATYTNLGPGHYTFKVKALTTDGLWSEVKTLQVNIEPPFWRTPLAYLIYALIAAGLFTLARRITLDRIHMRFELKQQRREAERAHALDQLKTKFFTNVSHEFRTPLSLIIAPLNKIIDHTADEEQRKQLNLVQRNAKRLLNLVNQLLDFRKMEVQEIKLHPSIGDIVRFCKDISHSFMDIAEKKRIQFSFSANIDSLEIYFDKDKMEKILFNLLSNAFKYTHDNGMVSINLVYNPPAKEEGDGTLAIEVKDTGIGIPADKHDKIFERFFQTDMPADMVNQGTGIGLAITKEFVKLHQGIIRVQSEPGKGTCFTVLLPAKKIGEPLPRTTTHPIPAAETEQVILEESQKSGKKKTILIVEDNEDLRFYLKDNLKAQYHVEEAVNGKEGWGKIKLLNPDLVVSDIMMPLMDGVELARKIKTETLTAHIPVILLTAMGSEEKQLEGLKVGVNDYITKPFTFEILASRIRNLLAQQMLLQKRFRTQIEVNPSEVTVTSVDEKFLQQALELVEKHMDNPEFSVEDFSRDMFMNRVTLYRKIHSLTGKSPLEFIRSIRLKRAARLLDKSGMSVAEIAYEVGFNNPKIFTKFFKEEFKVTPSQYAVNQKDQSA
ncbi:response regulator [Pseudoflavitalea sp. X16]|uniref:hybrid sensor histidine kinase/response regulator transcription factor n=1 Tax=Paraflavitalea devenefica TaxID=2716334 RepID=UPI00142298C0|nr:hybrid sensor histidine kinase/response regulator transcription factor [Paraflavitalea devenefica]NII29742.1 response regulator [Paraflavitalea devenefica]